MIVRHHLLPVVVLIARGLKSKAAISFSWPTPNLGLAYAKYRAQEEIHLAAS
jgi:hypothetical protein